MIRVLICDSQAAIDDGLAALLRMQPDITVAGQAREGAEAIALTVRVGSGGGVRYQVSAILANLGVADHRRAAAIAIRQGEIA